MTITYLEDEGRYSFEDSRNSFALLLASELN